MDTRQIQDKLKYQALNLANFRPPLPQKNRKTNLKQFSAHKSIRKAVKNERSQKEKTEKITIP
jgi:hypothetical protein